MTVGKATALAAGLVGAVAVGVAIGPTVQDTWTARTAPKTIAAAPMTEPKAGACTRACCEAGEPGAGARP